MQNMHDSDLGVLSNPLGILVTRSDVKVCIDNAYSRRKLPLEMEKSIDLIWQSRVEDNPRLFNGTKFRLHSIQKVQDGQLGLCVGVTCYKDFIGTNYSPQAQTFKALGVEQCDGNSQAFMSDAIGVGALLLTTDEHIVLLRRSMHVAEDVGLFDRPGGHAEPNELVGDIPMEQINVEDMSAEDVRNELFNSVIREVRDEVNIPEKYLEDPLLLGAYRNPASAGRPGLEFVIRCSLTSEEISDFYHQGTQAEADESTEIKFIHSSQLKECVSSDVTNSMKSVIKYYCQVFQV